MFPKKFRVVFSKPLYLICVLSSLTFTHFLIQSVHFQRFRRKLFFEYIPIGNITRHFPTNTQPLSSQNNINSNVSQKHKNDFLTPNQMSSFIENLPVKHDVDCDKFLYTVTFPEHPKNFYTKPQRVSETFDYDNCSNIRAQGFRLPVTSVELNHPIAFSILAYRDPRQVTRLIRAIYRPHNAYCIHIDIKSDSTLFNNIKNLSSCLENVFIAPVRLDVRWAKFTVLEPELLCMQLLLRHKVKWKSWINLTGQEFPLKTNLELVSVLDLMHGMNDVTLDNCTYGAPGANDLANCRATKNGWMERWPKHAGPPPYGIVPYKGSVHVMLSRDFVHYLVTSDPAKAYLRWLKSGMRVPDEFFFSTINYNLHLHAPGAWHNASVVKRNVARLKLWGRQMYSECLKVLRRICILSLQELPLLTSSYAMFANKFLQEFSPLGYSCLEKWYFRRVYREMATGDFDLDLNFYRNIYNSG